MTDTITGGCLCGAVRYECSAELSKIIACHCTDCQKASGSGASPPLTSDAGRGVSHSLRPVNTSMAWSFCVLTMRRPPAMRTAANSGRRDQRTAPLNHRRARGGLTNSS